MDQLINSVKVYPRGQLLFVLVVCGVLVAVEWSSRNLLALILLVLLASVALRRSGALRDSEGRYLFDYGADAILLFRTASDGKRLVVDVNEAACQRLGYSRSEMMGMDVAGFNGYPANREQIFAQLAQHGSAIFETVHLTRDGNQIPVEVHARTFMFRGESMTLEIVRDVTERYQAEREKEELRRNMQALLNAIQETTLLLDARGNILIHNDVAAQRLKIAASEMSGKNLYELLPPEVMRFRREKLEQILQRGLPQTYEDESLGHRYQSSVYPVRDVHGTIAGFAVYSADVTQQRRLQGIDELFSDINQLVLQGASLSTVLIVACKKVTDLFHLGAAWVGRKEPDGSISVLAGGGEASRYVDSLKKSGIRWDDSVQDPSGSAICSGRAQVFKMSDVHFDSWGQILHEHHLQAMLTIPLVIRDEIRGVFSLYSSDPVFFDTQAVLDMMTGISMRISVAMEAAMDQQQIRLLSSALIAAGNGVMITNARGQIQWVNPAFCTLSGYSRDELIGQTPRILKSGRQTSEYYQALWSAISRGEIWSSETTERARDGSLYTVSQTITPMLNDDGEVAHYIAIHEDVTAQILSKERIAYMAHFDALTALPNRALFYDRLKQAFVKARRSGDEMALLFLDLDGFKQVNDGYGHHVGDLLLKAVAERLQECVRESDTVARLGGDEFTVILNQTHGRESIDKVAFKIIETIAQPFDIAGASVRVGVSIGIGIYADATTDEESLVHEADQAMYAAKMAGKNTWRFFLPHEPA